LSCAEGLNFSAIFAAFFQLWTTPWLDNAWDSQEFLISPWRCPHRHVSGGLRAR
jgi:hypothetical protein